MAEKTDAIKEMNLYQKIWAVSSEVGKVKESLDIATKTDKNGRTLKSYKAVSINDVVDSLIPMLAKYRLAVVPEAKKIIKDEQVTTTSAYGDRTQFWVRMQCYYMIVNIDKPDETLLVSGYGDGFDSGDKACGKAETYARKFCLISAFNLSRGDDPDEEASQEYKPKEKKQEKPKYPSESEALPTELIVQIQDVRRQIEAYGVDTRGADFVKFMSEKAHVEELDPARMTLPEGIKALNAFRAVAEELRKKREKVKDAEDVPF